MKKVLSVILLALGVQAGIIEETKSKPVLAATVTVAPFAEVTAKVAQLGTMISNPLVPTLLMGSLQKQLASSYGRFRNDAPMYWLGYVQTPAWEVASTNDDVVALESLYDMVLVYPSVDKSARMLLNNPGSEKMADGTIHLLAGENRTEDAYVQFTADNRFCAFAASPALAAQALADLPKVRSAEAPERALVKMEVYERGLSAFATFQDGLTALQELAGKDEPKEKGRKSASTRLMGELLRFNALRQERQKELLKAYSKVVLSLDLTAQGLSLAGAVEATPHAKALPSAALPPEACRSLAAGVPFFTACNVLFQMGCASEAEFRQQLDQVAKILDEALAAAAEEEDAKKYATLLKDVGAVAKAAIKDARYPQPADWTTCALGFDAKGRLFVETVRSGADAAHEKASGEKALAGLQTALDRQWPGKGLFAAKGAGAYVFDWNALFDVCAAEAGVKPGDAEMKELAKAKRNFAEVMGTSTSQLTLEQVDGTTVRSRLAAPDFAPAPAGATGEARLTAALPETAKDPAAFVFYMTPYAFVRENLLPILAKFAKKNDRAQYKAMIEGMPAAEPNSALAAAMWAEKNGNARFLLRLTANELKNFGAAFNAFTAASMSAALAE